MPGAEALWLVQDTGYVAWARYASVHARWQTCPAVFDPRSLAMVTPKGRYEQWHYHATRDRVPQPNAALDGLPD